MKRLGTMLGAAALAWGCSSQPDAAPKAPPAQPVLAWASAASAAGVRLRLVRADGTLMLGLACLSGPARLQVHVPAFTPIGSEDRFMLGLGGEPVTLVADLAHPAPGVTASGPVPAGFAELVASGQPINALYGVQAVGPVPPPTVEMARACVAAVERHPA